MFEDFGTSLRVAFQQALSDLFAFVPRLFGAIILLLVGWFLGKLVGKLITSALRAVRFNEVADKAEIDTFLQNAGVRADPSAVVGALARWFIYLIFLISAFNALGLTQVSAVMDDVLTFIPKVIVALVIVLVGALAGTLLAGVVRGSLRSMGVGSADLFGTIARFAVIAFATVAALDMLSIAPNVINILWTGLVVLLVGTLVLAFGLGGRQAASDLTLGRMLRTELEPGTEIQTGTLSGRVRAIGSLFTTLETATGVVKVPNSALTAQNVQMTQEQYQQQVDKRNHLREQAKQAVQQATSQRGDGRQNDSRESASAPTITPRS